MTIQTVMYHYVRPFKQTRYPNIKGIDLKDFRSQLQYLKNNFEFIKIEDVISVALGKIPMSELPKNAVLLTFDDGYSDHFDYAFPVLHDMKIQGSFYIPKSVLLDRELLDVNKIHFLLAKVDDTKQLVDYIDREILNNNSKEIETLESYKEKFFIPNRWDTAEVIYIKRLLQHALPDELRKNILDKLFEKYVTQDVKAFSEELYLDTQQAKLMIDCGMHIGSHGSKHYWYNRISKDAQREDLIESFKMFEALNVTKENFTFCYPYGGYNNDSIELLNELGCSIAFSVEATISNDINNQNRFTIPRLDTNDVQKI